MDIRLIMQGDAQWQLKDPLGRAVGTVTLDTSVLAITPTGATLNGMTLKPYTSLDAVMNAIEVQAKGRCWIDTGMA